MATASRKATPDPGRSSARRQSAQAGQTLSRVPRQASQDGKLREVHRGEGALLGARQPVEHVAVPRPLLVERARAVRAPAQLAGLELGLGLREALEEDRDEGDALHVAELELLGALRRPDVGVAQEVDGQQGDESRTVVVVGAWWSKAVAWVGWGRKGARRRRRRGSASGSHRRL